MQRLLEHYETCLGERLTLWFGDTAVLKREAPCAFSVQREDLEAKLTFQPECCEWTMLTHSRVETGSFDKMSKRMRQYFSRIPGV